MKKILIPVDFSECSLNAVKYAAQLYRNEDLHLLILNAYPLAQGLDIPDHYLKMKRDSWQTTATAQFEELKQKIKTLDLPQKVTFDLILAPGSFVPELIFTSDKEQVDAIVMGTEGSQGLHKVLKGTHTSQVVTRMDCPVIVVPEGYHYRGVHTLVYATDCQGQDLEALRQVVDLARPYQAKIIVLHVETHPKSLKAIENFQWYKDKIQPEITYEHLQFEWLEHKNLQEALDNYLWDQQADLLIMLMQNRSWVNRVLHPSHTKSMAYRTQVPLWAFSTDAIDWLKNPKSRQPGDSNQRSEPQLTS